MQKQDRDKKLRKSTEVAAAESLRMQESLDTVNVKEKELKEVQSKQKECDKGCKKQRASGCCGCSFGPSTQALTDIQTYFARTHITRILLYCK